MFHLTTWHYCGKVGFSGAALPKPFRGTAKHQLEDPLLAFWQQGYLFFKITKACWNLLTIKMGPDNWSFFEIVRFALSIQMRQLLVGLVVLSVAEMFSSLNILLTDSSGTDRKSQIFHCPHYTSLHSLRQLFMGDTEADIDAWRKNVHSRDEMACGVCQSKKCKMTCFGKCTKCTKCCMTCLKGCPKDVLVSLAAVLRRHPSQLAVAGWEH